MRKQQKSRFSHDAAQIMLKCWNLQSFDRDKCNYYLSLVVKKLICYFCDSCLAYENTVKVLNFWMLKILLYLP